MSIKSTILSICAAGLLFTGCANKVNNEKQVVQHSVGKIQYEIKRGMYSADVIKALGSPNIITRNKDGKVTWVYDKIKTYRTKTTTGGLDFVRMNNNDYVITGGFAAGAAAFTASGGTAAYTAIALLGLTTLLESEDDYEIETQQKTLTLILDFNKSEQLDKFAYMYSSF